MAGQKAVAVLLVIFFVHGLPTAALSKLQASASTDELHRQAAAEPPTYAIGGGYLAPSGRAAEASCGAVGRRPITTLEECRSAAEQVGITITEMVGPGKWRHVPYGCSVQQGTATPESGAVGTNGRVHFSTISGDNNGGIGGYVLICKQAAVVSPPLTQRIALFSAQFGGRDRVMYRKRTGSLVGGMGDVVNGSTRPSLQIGARLPDSVDAFLFTDMINVGRRTDSQWQFVSPATQFEELCDDNVLCGWKGNPNLTQTQKKLQTILASKFFKIRWIAENTAYEYIVWMDGKYVMVNSDLVETIHTYMRDDVDMLVMRHPLRNTVAEELGPASERLAETLGDDSWKSLAHATYKRYKLEGFSDTAGLFDSAMFIVRPARVRAMFMDWWHEVQQGFPRDQVSLPWMIQKHGIRVSSIGPELTIRKWQASTACIILGRPCFNPNAHT